MRKGGLVAAVVVTRVLRVAAKGCGVFAPWLTLCGLCYYSTFVAAAVLPEDRIDVLYHNYDGGDVEIDGPSILVRKSVASNYSLSANYYVDTISSASIDVQLYASPYSEERKEKSVGLDYIHEKTSMNLGYTMSDENDFEARSFHFSMSQDFFGDLTTLSLGYSKGSDEVSRVRDNTFSEDVDRQHYRLGISQIVSTRLIMHANLEVITDEGYLNNPYRLVRYRNESGSATQQEVYPNTRTSNAMAIGARYFMPYRAVVKAEFRGFSDSWDISAQTFTLGYTHPYKEDWIFDVTLRYYKQDRAEFYSDLFPRVDSQNHLARDKELSTYSNATFGLGVSREFRLGNLGPFERASINLKLDRIRFTYDDYRDARQSAGIGATKLVGEESLYEFSATVTRFFFSLWY